MLGTAPEVIQHREPPRVDRRRLVLSLLVLPACLFLLMFLPAGTWAWAKGWLFIAVFLVLAAAATLVMRRVNPDLIADRVNRHEGTEPWDKVVVAFFFLAMCAIFPVAA